MCAKIIVGIGLGLCAISKTSIIRRGNADDMF